MVSILEQSQASTTPRHREHSIALALPQSHAAALQMPTAAEHSDPAVILHSDAVPAD